jgi:hypothetical protein
MNKNELGRTELKGFEIWGPYTDVSQKLYRYIKMYIFI